MTAEQNPEQAIARALDAIQRAYEQAAAIIAAISDPQEAFDRANDLARGIRRVFEEEASKLRAQQVERIWESEEMVLEELAGRIGVGTKQRAHQILQAAKKTKEEQPCQSP